MPQTKATADELSGSFPTNYRRNTTNSVANAIIQHGRGMISIPSTSDGSQTLTFPVAFKSGTIPTVVAQFYGYGSGGTFQDTTNDSWGGATFSAQNATNTAVTIRARRNDGSAFGGDYYYTWIAVGVPA